MSESDRFSGIIQFACVNAAHDQAGIFGPSIERRFLPSTKYCPGARKVPLVMKDNAGREGPTRSGRVFVHRVFATPGIQF